MKNPLWVISTDWHLRRDNIFKITSLVLTQCQLATKLNLKHLVVLGDIFDDRKSQTQDVLLAFYNILETCKKYALTMIVIPGNHDKMDYKSEDSFLHAFRSHHNCRIIDGYEYVDVQNTRFHFIPYFDENASYKQYLKKVNYSGQDVLFSHIGLSGSINNDRNIVSNSLLIADFDRFKYVFLGHYHNCHKISKNIVHLGSLYQRNFGEDVNKGYTVLYDDLSYELIKSDFMEHHTVEIDVHNVTTDQIIQSLSQYDTTKNRIRVVLKGKTIDCKSINSERLRELGFIVTSKATDIMNDLNDKSITVVKPFSKSIMEEHFKEYCDLNNVNHEKGLQFLQLAFR